MTYIPFGKHRKMHRNTTLIEVTFLFTLGLSRVALTYKIEIFRAYMKCCCIQSSSQKKKEGSEELKFTAHWEYGVWRRRVHGDRHPAHVLWSCRCFCSYRSKSFWSVFSLFSEKWRCSENKATKPALSRIQNGSAFRTGYKTQYPW